MTESGQKTMEELNPSQLGTKEYCFEMNYDEFDENWEFDILTASAVGDIESVEGLLRQEQNSETFKNSTEWTPIMYAGYFGHASLVELLLLNKKFNVRDKNDKGRNALMLSAYCGHGDVVKVILDNVKDSCLLEDTDPSGWTPLSFAVAMGHDSLVERLIEYGSDIHHRTNSGESCLVLARQRGHDRVVEKIFQHHQLATSIYAGPRQALALLEQRKASMEESKQIKAENLECMLKEIGLEKYYPIFQSKGVELKQFAKLSDQDLKDLGISLLGPRRKMTSAMAKLKHSQDS